MKPATGLISLFAGLYDSLDPQYKFTFEPFITQIVEKLTACGLNVLEPRTCVHETDIQNALRFYEQNQADAVIILFLAYHPSLVSAGALAGTSLPVIFLDTTECFAFDEKTDPDLIMRCHGIHGVQDLTCVLRRLGKDYHIEAGHYTQSDVIRRVADSVKACFLAGCLKNSRVGIVGEPFDDMGDFAMSFASFAKNFGLKIVSWQNKPTDTSANQERDNFWRREIMDSLTVSPDAEGPLADMAVSSTADLAQWIDREKLDAFSFNFLDFNHDLGLAAIPFVASSLFMSRGIGYAGEGDVLTAALVAALMKIYPASTFTEMFCPDWQGDRVFLSHMGEVNLSLLQHPVLVRKEVEYVPNLNQGITPGVAGALKGGQAILVNLAPLADDQYQLILAPCEIVEAGADDRFQMSVRGWMRPKMPLADFLAEYSRLGGTHHSCLCYGADLSLLHQFSNIMGWQTQIIGN